MNIGHKYDCFRDTVQPALVSKLEEFRLLGYDTITETSLWEFLTKKKWKKNQEDKKLFEIVQDIMSVDIGDFMNYATIQAFKMDEFSFANEEERRELLK